ncbi:MAG: serine/threonine-protein kinase [Actinomycetes bacterium]
MNQPWVPAGLPTRYRLGGVAGRGGTATVWRARDTQTGQDVVVKVLGAVPAARFESEARALGRLVGIAGVVDIRSVGRTGDGRPWLVEELVVGPTLADHLRSAPWPGPQVRHLVRSLGTTLAAVHGVGVVHGDLAPANVLCRSDETYVLCDFGVAALGGPAGGPVPCTPSFAAPERRAGGAATPASDVFGLAALGWFAATGTLPTAAVSAGSGPGCHGLGRRLSAALRRALDPDPGCRPTAAALARRAR